jgi:tight adherence protein B
MQEMSQRLIKSLTVFAERIDMDGMFLPILIAAVVVLIFVSIWQVVRVLTDPDRRKLKERLSTEGPRKSDSNAPLSITMNQEATGLSGQLAKLGPLQGIYRQILQAWPDLSLASFLSICLGLAAVFFFIAFAMVGAPIVALVAAAIGGYIPFIMLSRKRSNRQRKLADQLPDALDFLARILKAGHSLSTGLQMMSTELPKPLGAEFGRAYDQHSLGMPMEDALKDMAVRIESTDFAFFVTATLIQRQTGGDLSEVLNNISGMIRQRIRLAQSVKSKTAEGRFTGYILSAFPAVMFVIASILNPDYTSVLWKTTTGMILLCFAFGFMLTGLFCIKKITTVRV